MNIKKYNLHFESSINLQLSEDKKKGILINELEFNYWLLKLLIETKNKFLNDYKKNQIKTKAVLLNSRFKEQKDYINKIISNSKIYKIKNIYTFDIVEYKESYLEVVKTVINDNSLIKNVKYLTIHDTDLNKKDVIDVIGNVDMYCHERITNWDNNKINNEDIFDYTEYLNNINNATLGKLKQLITSFKLKNSDFYKTLLVKEK